MADLERLKSAIDAYADNAYGTDQDGGELSRQRALALDAYQGKNIEPAPEGMSQVIDWSVFETVQWILPSLTRIFAGGDDVVEFEPFGPEDEDVAQQESEVLNYIVTQKNNWFLTCLEWFQDALITKNAYCLAFMEDKIVPEIERYEGQSEEQVALLLEDDVEIVGQEQYIEEGEQGPILNPLDGQPVEDPAMQQQVAALYQELGQEPQFAPVFKYNIEVKRTKTTKRLQFRVLPPENCLVGEDTPSFTLDECNYFEYYEHLTISDLRKMGYDVDDDINDDGVRETQEDEARDELLQTYIDEEGEFPDPSMRPVKVRTIWIRHDNDEDGIAELQRVVRVGNEILDHEPASCIPVASIVPFINTHRHMGTSIADLTFDIQRIKTAMLRSGIDSLYLGTRPRHAVSDKVNLDDMLISRAGSLVRLKNGAIPGEGHIMPLPTENTFPYAQQGLEHMDRVTEARVGVTRQFQGIDESASNDHNRIGQLSSMAAQRVEQIARIFGNGVERLFRISHELVIKSGHSMDAIRLRGKWVDIDPTQWRTGRDMRVVAPFAAGNKDSLIQRLMIIAGFHEKALAGGLPIVDASDSYELALELAAAADLKGTKFFTDPATVEPPPPPPDYTMMALEIENKKADNEAEDEGRRAELESFKVTTDAEIDKYKADLNAELQLALAQLKAGQAVDLERVKANFKDNPITVKGKQLGVSEAFSATAEANQKMAETLSEALKEFRVAVEKTSGPKKVIRDSAGKVVGTEPA